MESIIGYFMGEAYTHDHNWYFNRLHRRIHYCCTARQYVNMEFYSYITLDCTTLYRTGGVLSVGIFQRLVQFWPSDSDADGSLRSNAFRTMHEREPRQQRMLGRRSASSGPALFRSPQLCAPDTRCCASQHPPLPKGTHALPRSLLHVRHR